MTNATRRGSEGNRPSGQSIFRGWHRGVLLGTAALALGLAGAVLSVEARAQAKKKKGVEAPPAQADTAAAQRAYAAGSKAFEAGDMAAAQQQLSAALAGGGLPNSQMARALYLRGAASRRLGKPAQAISDLTTAVWLKGGLSDTDKAKANEERQLAYREAGLGDTPPPIGAAPLDQSTKSAAGGVTPSKPGTQVVQVTEQSFWNNFSMPTLPSLTGSSQPAQPTETAAAAAAPQAESGQSSSFWSFLSPGSPPAEASAGAAAPALGIAPQPASAETGVAGSLTGAPAVVPTSWETQTAAVAVSSEPAAAAVPIASGYASQPVAETGISTMGALSGFSSGPTAGASPPSTLSNPLAGTGTAVSNFFGNMFGSGSSAPAEPATSPVMTGSTEQPPHWGAETTAATGQTSSMVQRGPDSPPPSSGGDALLPWGAASSAAPAAAAPAKVAAVGGAGKYKLQVAAVRSRAEADRLAQTLTAYPPVREGKVTAEIDEAVIGSMGTFYRVRLGPYANASEPNQLCKTLKPQGFDCLVVSQ